MAATWRRSGTSSKEPLALGGDALGLGERAVVGADALLDLIPMGGGVVERDHDLALVEAELFRQRCDPLGLAAGDVAEGGGDLPHVWPSGQRGAAARRAGLEHDARMSGAGQSLPHETLDQFGDRRPFGGGGRAETLSQFIVEPNACG